MKHLHYKSLKFSVIIILSFFVLIGCTKLDRSTLATTLTLTSSSKNLTITQNQVAYVILKATVLNKDGQALPSATVEFRTDSGSLTKASDNTDFEGVVEVRFSPVINISGTATVTAFINGLQQSVEISTTLATGITTENTDVANIKLNTTNATIVANGLSVVRIDAIATNDSKTLLSEKNITFTTNKGSLLLSSNAATGSQSVTVSSNSVGQATVFLRSTTSTSTVIVRAESNGVNASASMSFIAGDVDDANTSVLTINPSTIPADGISTATVDVLLLDANNNIVSDVPVTLISSSSLAAIISTNPVQSVLGHAIFTLRSTKTAGVSNISVSEYPNLQGSLLLGTEASDTSIPSSITVEPSSKSLFVNGIGKDDSTTINITVKTSSGNLVQDADAGINNLRVTLTTSSNSGETLTGASADGSQVQDSSEILVRTKGGVASITLKSGRNPSVINLQVEALSNTGSAINPVVRTINSEINIASGPPHSITISYPNTNSIINVGNGTYRRVGTLAVTDQYGNAVPDDTAINLGYLDSIIVSNRTPLINTTNVATGANINTGSITGSTFTSTNISGGDFRSVSITRNNSRRLILQNDRILITNAASNNKSRFINSIGSNSITVTKPYNTNETSLSYLIGAPLLGGQVSGITQTETTEPGAAGLATTKKGLATFYITYPADKEHILTGCYNDPTLDTRVTPVGSAQTFLIAESNDTGAATIDNRGCFAAIAPVTVTNSSGILEISSSANITFILTDANNVELPFTSLIVSVSYTVNEGGLNVSVSNSCAGRTDLRTNIEGSCTLSISVTGGASRDSAVVKVVSGEGSSEVKVNIP